MSFALPPVKVKPETGEKSFSFNEGAFGVPNVLSTGTTNVKSSLEVSHPLIASEANYAKNKERMNLTILRNTQGLHAPLRIGMELKAASKVGHLQFLPSSNVMHDVLTGRDEEIDFEDILGVPEFREISGQPHAVMERSLGIL